MDKAGSGKGRYTVNNPYQAAMLETLDRSVGTVIDTLDEFGLAEHTLVIFFSDNGQLGPRNGAPLRGSKADLYEGGIRMPFIVKWPGVVPAGSTTDELVISNDFFPTFAAIAGADDSTRDIDGINLLPVLKDPERALDRTALYWHYPHYHGNSLGPQGSIRKGRFKLVEWFERSMLDEAGAFELYDLVEDPKEETNCARSRPALAAALRQELQQWRIQVGAQRMMKRDL
jgi:uncharacterized sulfatase